MILLEHVRPHAYESQPKLVEQSGAEDARPFQSCVLPMVQRKAAITRERGERVDRIERTEDVLIDQGVMRRYRVGRSEVVIQLGRVEIIRTANNRGGEELS